MTFYRNPQKEVLEESLARNFIRKEERSGNPLSDLQKLLLERET